MFTGNLLTTSPTATSSLFFGLGTYSVLGGGFLGGVNIVGRGNDCLGARDHVDIDEVERAGTPLDLELHPEKERVCNCEKDEASEKVGDAVHFVRPVSALGLAGVPTVRLTGVADEETSDDKLVVRCRDANVELEGFEDEGVIGPETDRAEEDTVDKRLVDLLGVSVEPETTRLATD